jgi:hypothetical protein
MVSHIVMRTPSVRKALLEALLLALAGCAPSPYERGGNPRGLSQRDVERDYMEYKYRARLANEQYFYSQSSPSPFGPGPKARATTLVHCMGYRASTQSGYLSCSQGI